MSRTVTTAPRFRRYSSEQRSMMLIEAGLACLSRGGILEFTIDKVCTEANVSRGLITHHFKSKDGLLAAVYATMYGRMLAVTAPADKGDPDISKLTNAVFAPELFDRQTVNIWLALWGEIANNAALQAEHRKQYGAFRRHIAGVIAKVAKERKVRLNAALLAATFIALVDGLWLEQCLDPGLMSAKSAKEACFRMLEAFLGPLAR